jgi:hypothetical protein
MTESTSAKPKKQTEPVTPVTLNRPGPPPFLTKLQGDKGDAQQAEFTAETDEIEGWAEPGGNRGQRGPDGD